MGAEGHNQRGIVRVDADLMRAFSNRGGHDNNRRRAVQLWMMPLGADVAFNQHALGAILHPIRVRDFIDLPRAVCSLPFQLPQRLAIILGHHSVLSNS